MQNQHENRSGNKWCKEVVFGYPLLHQITSTSSNCQLHSLWWDEAQQLAWTITSDNTGTLSPNVQTCPPPYITNVFDACMWVCLCCLYHIGCR